MKAAVDAAEALNRGDYTAESWQAFQKAMAAARQQLVNPESAEAVAAALEALTQAQDALVELNVNTSELEQAIAAADKLQQADYTADSWKPFEQALAAAKNVLKNPTNQQAIDDAVSALHTAQDALVKAEPAPNPDPDKPDTSALQAAVDAAKQLQQSDYTADSWTAFADALKAAEDVLANPDASESDIASALNALTKAQDALVKADVTPDPKPNPDLGPNPAPNPDDTNSGDNGDGAGDSGTAGDSGNNGNNGTTGGNGGVFGTNGGATSGGNGSTLSQTGDNVPVAPLAATGLFGGIMAAIAAFFTRRKRQQ